MGHRRQFRLAVCAVGVIGAACNGVLGIHELAGDAATTEAGISDATTDSTIVGPADSSAQETGAEASLDSGIDSAPCDPDAFAVDPANCGSCGHNCLGGMCEAGACQPFSVSVPQDVPYYLALWAETVYWTESANGNVESAPKSGGNAHPILVGQAPNAGYLAVDGQRLYWGNNNNGEVALTSCPLSTCGSPSLPVALSAGVYGGLYTLALADGSVFANANQTGVIVQCPVDAPDGGPCTSVVSSLPYPNGVAADADGIYWTQYGAEGPNGALYMCPLAGCGVAPTLLVNGRTSPTYLVVDANNVYWIEYAGGASPGSLFQCPKTHCANNVVTLATGLQHPQSLAVDSTYVYWVNAVSLVASGSVQSCTIGDCEMPTTRATSDLPYDVAVDDAAVYWTAQGPATPGIWKIAK